MVFFFYGPNTYAARQQIAKLVVEYVKKSGDNFGIERLDGAKVKPEELRASLQAAPFLSRSRLVIIEDLGANKLVAAAIAGYVKDVPDTTVAIFYEPNVDQRTAYFKTLKTAAKTVVFESLPATKLLQWLAREAAAADATIEQAAAKRLLELAGEDQWRLSNEVAKLATYGTPITTEAVEAMVEESHTETIFNLVEAMTAGNAATAMRLYRQLLADGQHEVYMLSMVIWQLRNLLLAKTAGATSPPQLAKTAGMSPFVASKMLSKRHLFSEQQLKTAFLQAVDTDYQIKSGAGSPDILVEQLILYVAAQVPA
jgi:DNA polymerase-3 subunit delta